MIIVYIASAYTKGDVAQNVRVQIDVADKLSSLKFLPLWPLSSHFWHMIHPHPYEYWMDVDLQWILKCDCVLRLPGESAGADMEVKYALDHDIGVFYNIEDLVQFWQECGA